MSRGGAAIGKQIRGFDVNRQQTASTKMLFLLLAVSVLVFILLIDTIFCKKPLSIKNKHVVVTGGSSGIGKAIAVLAAKHGAHVTIIARNLPGLEEAEAEIKAARISDAQKIRFVSLDVTSYTDVNERLNEIDLVHPIFMLVNCAGTAICGKIEDTPISDVKKLMDLNYFGTYNPIKAVVKRMKARREGSIVITGSQGSLLGIFGYSAYSGSKFAVKGLAEALDMEVRPYNVYVTLALPPDTDTPGFASENQTKPKETRMISEVAGLFKSDKVAKKIMKDALSGNFLSHIGFESFLLTTMCCGMAPVSTLFEIVYQSCLLGPLRLVGAIYLAYFHGIIERCIEIEDQAKKKYY